jgi:hypothetical protein
MTIEELNLLVKELASTSNVTESSILDSIANSAKLKFGKIASEEERELIDKIKKSLILGYYQMPNHSYVTKRPDFKGKFGFDDFDMKYLPSAGEELENEELIVGNENYTALTEKGIIYAKRLKGEF